MTYMPLGELLIAEGTIDREQLRQGLEKQQQTGKRLGQTLVELGCLSQWQLMEALQRQLEVEFVDLTSVTIPVELARYIPLSIARKYKVVPVKLEGGALYVAMEDPLDYVAQEDIRQTSRRQVIPMLATPKATQRAIASLYSNEGAARVIEEMKQEAAPLLSEQSQVSAADKANSAPTIRFVDSLIERAFTERASDIHLEPQGEQMVVRMRIDGQLRNLFTVPAKLQDTVTYRLKIMGGMNISERRLPQDGHALVTVKGHELDLRIASIPTIYGEKLVVRLLDKSSQPISKDTLGLMDRELGQYEQLLENSSGIILIVGPTGSGKSTTMYAMLQQLAREEVNIISLEDPVEYHIPGVTQCQINEKTGMTFSTGLRAILRQDPDIISVGEIRDGETASIATRAAITGHLVLSTLHTNDALLAVDRLKDIGVEPYLISGALRGVISQRLVRKICPHCRRSYKPTEHEKRLVGLKEEAEVVFYRGEGCPECYHTGYYGRTAVFEILMLTGELQRLIRCGASYDELLAAAEKNGHVTMARNCARLVLDGITSAREAARAIHSTLQ